MYKPDPNLVENNAPWRQTPLDHWSKDIDPAIMSGDEWVDNDHDPGSERYETRKIATGDYGPNLGLFMHPTLDVTYGTELDKGQED